MSQHASRPAPDITPRMRPFWTAAAEGRLTILRCTHCGTKHFPAVDICNGCLHDDLEWIDASGRASVFSFVVMHQVYHPAFADRAPYVVADVELDEGPRIISTVIGCDPHAVRIGMRLAVEFEQVERDDAPDGEPAMLAIPVFTPLG